MEPARVRRVRADGARRRTVLLLSGLLLLAVVPPAVARQDDGFEVTGLQPTRAYFSGFPWERIDTYSGNLLLTFTDLVLPGNAGFDLRITRSFNSRGRPSRWQFGPMGEVWIDENGIPRLATGDGAKEWAVQTASGSGVYRTKGYWEYTPAQATAVLPSGVTYRYDRVWNTTRYLTEMNDPFGNRITLAYEQPDESRAPVVTTIVQDLGGGQTRTVTFGRDAHGRIESMTYDDRIWRYGWNACGQIESVTPPVGSGWTFGYSTTCDLTSVTTPSGGVVSYTYDTYPAGREGKSVVTRTVSGRDVKPGTWTLEWPGPWAAVKHGATEVRYECAGYGYNEGALISRQTLENGKLLETETLGWQASVPIGVRAPSRPSATDDLVPLLSSRTVWRTGAVSGTSYAYRPDYLNDYGHPFRIVETGDFSRLTEVWFKHDFAGFIRGRVAEQRVCSPSGSVTDDTHCPLTSPGAPFQTAVVLNGYDSTSGFLTSRTVNGIPVTFAPDAEGSVTHGNVASETDATGFTLTYKYDQGVRSFTHTPKYDETRGINADGTVGWQRRVVNSGRSEGSGFQLAWDYDDLGRVIESRPRTWSVELQEGATVTDYTSHPGESIVTRLKESVITQSLDGFGRVIQTKNSLDVTATTRYDADGRVEFESLPFYAPNGAPPGTTTSYDALGRITRRDAADGGWVRYDYPGRQVTASEHWADGQADRVTIHAWAASGSPDRARLAAVRDADGWWTAYAYDALDALIGVCAPVADDNPPACDPSTAPRRWVYDGRHQLVSEVHPESGTATYAYDDAGRLACRTDAAGVSLRYYYDHNQRLDAIDQRSGSCEQSPGTPLVSFEFSIWDNRLDATRGPVHTAFEYDPSVTHLVRRTDTLRAGAPDERVFATEFKFHDQHGNYRDLYYQSGLAVHLDVDAENRMWKVFDRNSGAPYAVVGVFHPSGAIQSYTAGNGLVHEVTYDAATARPWKIRSGPLALDYEYDHPGNVRGITDARTGYSQSYQYDPVDRLTSATGVWGTQVFAYDERGDRAAPAGTSDVWTYGPGGTRRLQRTVLAGIDTTYEHDETGALKAQTRGGVTDRFSYTPDGLLETATVGGIQTGYQYDADGLRVSATSGGTTRYFLRGTRGELLSEYEETGGTLAWQADHVYLGTRLVATIRPAPPVSPTVAAVSPSGGPTAGGTTLTLTGTGFVAGQTAVLVGGAAAIGVTVGSATSLTAVTPAHAAGPADVTVTTPAGSGTRPAAFTFVPVVAQGLGFDRDATTDLGVYRPSTGEWRVLPSANGFTTPLPGRVFGASGDQPLRGDFDGDGVRDPAVYRPSTGTWFWLESSTNYTVYTAVGWGVATDVPVPGDYDGDGTTDPAVYRPSTGTWFVLESHAGYTTSTHRDWGVATDVPVPGDYDGDGTSDLTVYRPSTGTWFILESHAAYTTWTWYGWGAATDVPLPADFDGDRRQDLLVYRPSTGTWFWRTSSSGYTQGGQVDWGAQALGDDPVPGDYDGDGKTDLAVFRPGTGQWLLRMSASGYVEQRTSTWGAAGDVALGGRR